MKECIGEARSLALDTLLKIPANFIAIPKWAQLPAATASKDVNKRRRHYNVSKTGFISQLGNDPAKTDLRDVLVDESKRVDIENLGDCQRALGHGQQLGEFSLTNLLYKKGQGAVDSVVGQFAGVVTSADGTLFAENQLNPYFAIVPGNYSFNLRWLYRAPFCPDHQLPLGEDRD
jgi:type IV secretion system protein VirB4